MTTTTTRDRFATLDDARTELDGTASWEWAPGTSWDAWVAYAYRYAVETVDEMGDRHWDHDGTLAAYLLSCGVDPSEMQLDGYDLAPVIAMCERQQGSALHWLGDRKDIEDALEHAQIPAHLSVGTFDADFADRDVRPGSRMLWRTVYLPSIGRGAAWLADERTPPTWTDADSPAEVLARVLAGTARN